jgi:hypothetical protein
MSLESVRHGSPFRASVAALAVLLAASCSASAQTADDEPTIEALLKSGWQIPGYTRRRRNWSTFVLFRHPDQTYLVQCRTGYDATREPHIKPHCSKLR